MNHIRIPDWQSRGRGFESHLLQGTTRLVADQGDDFLSLMTYLSEIGVALESGQIADLASQVNSGAIDMNYDISGLTISSNNGMFENLVGTYLTNKFDQNKSWGNYSPNYGYNCSPTLANRAAEAVKYVYGESSEEFSKLDRSNIYDGYIGYHLFQNNFALTNNGNSAANNHKYGPNGIAGHGVTNLMRGHSVAGALEYSGTGTFVPESKIWSGLTPGAVLAMGSHTAIFIKYTYTGNNLTGMVIWDDHNYYREIIKGANSPQPRIGGNWH